MFPAPHSPPALTSGDTPLVQLWLSLKRSPHTRRAYAAEAARFLAFIRKPFSLVTLADLQAWSSHLEQGSNTPATANRARTAIKSLLSFGQQSGYLPFNAGAALPLRPQRDGLAQRILDEGEVARLLEAAPAGRDRILLQLLYVSGARVSEICELLWRDAAPRREGGQITLFGKGGKTRSILLTPKSWQQLLSLGPGSPASPIFASRRGGGPLDPSQVRRIVYTAARRAGLDRKISPHWLRHAHASHALDRRAPIHLVQATLGHASIATTGRYLHARPGDSSAFYLPE